MLNNDITEALTQEGLSFESLIGKTKNSQVIKVKDRDFNDLAVKIIAKACWNKNELKFLKENTFKGVIKLKYNFEYNHRMFLVFKFYKNDLKKGVDSNPTYSTKQNWAKELLDILCDLEKKNFYHRDIKPENILLKGSSIEKSKILMCDFGSITNEIEFSKSIYFTPHYAPPEGIKQLRNTKKTEIWCFGQVILYIFTQQSIDPEADEEESFKRLRVLCERDVELYNVLTRCFSTNPDGRTSFAELMVSPFFTNTIELANYSADRKVKSKFKKAANIFNLLKNSKPTMLKKIWVGSVHFQVLSCVKSHFRRVFENLRLKVSNQIHPDTLKQIEIKIDQYTSTENNCADVQGLENLVQLYEEFKLHDENDVILKKALKSVLKHLNHPY